MNDKRKIISLRLTVAIMAIALLMRTEPSLQTLGVLGLVGCIIVWLYYSYRWFIMGEEV